MLNDQFIKKLEKRRAPDLPGSLIFRVDKQADPDLHLALQRSIPVDFSESGFKILTLHSIDRSQEVELQVMNKNGESSYYHAKVIKKEQIEEEDGTYFGIQFEFFDPA